MATFLVTVHGVNKWPEPVSQVVQHQFFKMLPFSAGFLSQNYIINNIARERTSYFGHLKTLSLKRRQKSIKIDKINDARSVGAQELRNRLSFPLISHFFR